MTVTIRMARPLDDYPALLIIPEADLIPVIRVEECACGEYVRQLAGDMIVDTVRRHNGTLQHRAWRYQSAADGPTAALSPVDVSEELPGASGRLSPAGARGRVKVA